MDIFTFYRTRVAVFTLVFMHAFAIMGNSNVSNESINKKKEIQLKTFPVFNQTFPSDSGGFVFDSSFFTNYQKSLNGFPPIWDTPHPSDGIHGILVKLQANPRINNIPIEPGDFIGGFYLDNQNNRKCGGAYFWVDTLDIQFVLFKNDPDTPEKDGFNSGETIQFRIFSWTTMKDYVVDVMGYDTQAYPYTDKWYHLGVSKVINMQALETIDYYITASPNPICTGNMLTLNANEFIGNGGPYIFNWTSIPAGFISNLQNPPSFPVSANTTFFLTVTSGTATSNHQLAITVNAFPTANAGSNGTICSNLGFNLNGTAGNYESVLWTTSGDGTYENPSALATTYYSGLSDGNNGSATLTLTANPLVPCTTTYSDDLLLTVIPAPRVNFGPDVTFCSNELVILDSQAEFYSSLIWATSGNGTFEANNGPVRQYFPSSTDISSGYVNITVTAQPENGCSGIVSDQVKVSFLPGPTCNAPTSRTKCENQPINTSGTASNYSSILWTTSGDGYFENPNVFTTNYIAGPNDKLAETAILTLTAFPISPCLTPATKNMTAIIVPLPRIYAGSDATISKEAPYYQIPDATASKYNGLLWSTNGDGSFSGITTTNPKYYPGNIDKSNGIVSLTLTGTPISPCSVNKSDVMILTINDGNPLNAGPDQTICDVVPVEISGFINRAISSVLWSTSGDGTFEQATSLETTYFPGTNDGINQSVILKLEVVETANPGVVLSDSLNVSITRPPLANAGPDVTICLASSIPLEGIVSNQSSIQWTSSGNGTFSNPTNSTTTYTFCVGDIANGIVTLTLTAFPISPCTVASVDTKVITLQNPPAINAGSDATICQGQIINLVGNASNYQSILWTTTGDGTFSFPGIHNPSYIPGNQDIINGSVILTLTGTAISPCTQSANDALLLIIKKNPTVNAGSDSSICGSQTSVSLTGSATNYSTVSWTTSGNGTFSSASTLTPVYSLGTNDKTIGTVTLSLTANPVSPCSASQTDNLIITIQKAPVAYAGEDNTIDESIDQYCLAGAYVENASSSIWTTSGTGQFLDPAMVLTCYVRSASDLAVGFVNLTLSANPINPCLVGFSDEMKLTLRNCQTAIANAGPDQSLCSTVSVVTLTGSSQYSSSSLWSTLGDGTFTNASSLTTQYYPGVSDLSTGTVGLCLTAYSNQNCNDNTDCLILTFTRPSTANAGADATICQNQTITLSGQATQYSGLQWSTSGNGTFSSASILNPVYTPGATDISNTTVNLTLTAAPISPCSVNASDFMVLTIQKSPTANAGADATICQTGTRTLSGAATDYSSVLWTSSGNGTFSSTSSLAPVYTPGTTDITNGSATLTITANPISPCTVSATDAMILSIRKSPTANAGDDATICQNQTHSLSGSSASNHLSVQWTTSGNGTFSNANTLTAVYTPGTTDITNGSVTLTLTATAISPCTLASIDTKILTIRKLPSANAGADAIICQGTTPTLSGTATNHSGVLWTTSGNGTFSSTSSLTPVYTPGTTDITNGIVTLTLNASAYSPCTTAAIDAMDLTIQKSPTANAGSDVTICQTDPIALSGSAANYSTILWTTSGNGTFSSASSLNPDYTPGTNDITNGTVNLTFTATAILPCSGSVSDLMVVTINRIPTIEAGLDATICENATHQLNGTAADYNTVVWSTSGNGTFNNTNNLNAIYTPGSTDKTLGSVTLTLTATPKNNCGSTVTDSKILSVTKLPTANAGNDNTVCQTTAYQLSGTASNHSGIVWTTSGNGTFSSASSLTAVYTPGSTEIASGTVTLTLTASAVTPCTASAVDAMTLSITKSPSVNVGNDATLCQTQNHNLSATATNHNGYIWSTTGDGNFSNSNVLNPTYTLGPNDKLNGLVTITLTANPISPCSLPVSDDKILTIIKTPTVNAGADNAICQGSNFTLNATAANYSSILWTTTRNGTFSSSSVVNPIYFPGTTDISNGTATLRLTAQPVSPCSGSVYDEMVLTIQKIPTVFAGQDQTLCQPASVSLTGATAANQGSLMWTTSGNGTFSNPTALNTIYYFGSNDQTNGSVTLTLTAYPKSPCPDPVSDTKLIIIQKSPTANAGFDATICQNVCYTLSGAASNNSSIEWSTNRNGTFDDKFMLNATYCPGTQDVNTGITTLTLTSKPLTPCTINVTDNMSLTVRKSPTANAGPNATICSGGNHTLNGSVSNQTSFVWSTSGDGTFSSTTSLTARYYPGNLDITNGSVELKLTANGNSPCSPAVGVMILTIQKLPTANAGADATICQNQTHTLPGTASNQAGVLWTTSGNGTFSSASALTPVYTPGTTDITNGSVTLTLTANAVNPCTGSVADAMILTLRKAPTANAGPDITVCEDYSPIPLSGTATNYSGINWATSGSGTFSNTGSLTSGYFPSPGDVNEGMVTLTLTATGLSPCVNIIDQQTVVFQKVPVAFAGEDITVVGRATTTRCLTTATILNSTGCNWVTGGTGTFNNPALVNPCYSFSTSDFDNGFVVLTITAYAVNPCTVNDSDEMMIIFESTCLDATANAGPDATVCENDVVAVNGSAENADSYLWTTNGNGTFANNTLLSTTYYPGTNDILQGSVSLCLHAYATDNCNDAVDCVQITFSKSPLSVAGTDATICQSGIHTLTGTAYHYSTILWTTSGNGSFSSTSSLNPVYTPGNIDIMNGSVNLTLTANAQSPCTVSVSDFVILTIQKSPIVNAGQDATICQTGTHGLSGTAADYSGLLWTTSGNGTFSAASSLTPVYTPGTMDITNGSVTLTFTANAVNPCSGSVTDQMVLTLRKLPTANAGNDATICQNQTHSLSGSSATNQLSVQWSTSGDGSFTNGNTLTADYNPGTADITNGSVTLTLTATAISPCTVSSADSKILIIQKSPAANAGADATICQTGTHGLSGTAADYSGLLWTTSGNGTFSSASSLTPVYTPGTLDITNGTVTLTFTANAVNPCSGSVTDQMVLTLRKLPTAYAGQDASILKNESYTLADAVANYSSGIQWSTLGDGSFNDIFNVNATYFHGTGDGNNGSVVLTLFAQPVEPCILGSSDEMTLTISVNCQHAQADAGEDISVCNNDEILLYGSASYYSSTIWETSGDGLFENPDNLNTRYLPGSIDLEMGMAKLCLTAYSLPGCEDSTSCITVTIFNHPTVVLPSNDIMCSSDVSVSLAGIAADYSSIIWTTSGDGTFDDPGILNPYYFPGGNDRASGLVTLELTATGFNNCGTATGTTILTLTPTPEINISLSETSICYFDEFELSGLVTGSDFSGVQWFTTNGGGYYSDEYSLTPLYYPSPTVDYPQGCIELYVVASAINPCSVSAQDAINLCFQAPPTVNAGSDETICETDYLQLSSTATNFSGLEWLTNGDGYFDQVNITNPVYYPGNQDKTNETVSLTFIVSPVLPCVLPVTDELILTIQPEPLAYAGEDVTILKNESYTLADAAAKNSSSIQWSTAGDGTFDDQTAVNATYFPGENDNDLGSVTLSLYVQPIEPCTQGILDEITLTISFDCQHAQADAGEDFSVCIDDEILLNGTAAYYSSVGWISSGDGTFVNPTDLNTRYLPGTNDQEQGEVELCLTAYALPGCEDSTSCITLTIFKHPTVELPSNIIMCSSDVSVSLSGNATDYSSLNWTTIGDGTFDDPGLLNPYYFPGENDRANGFVTLELAATGFNYCGSAYGSTILTFSADPEINISLSETSICYFDEFDFSSLVTGSDFSGVQWFTTNGGGYYSDEYSLTPIYYPSPTVDYPQGCIELYVVASAINPCSVSAQDAINLCFQGSPTAYAGEDQTICDDLQFINIQGDATNYSSLDWQTSGDGTFVGQNQLLATYYPGFADSLNGFVTLSLTANGNSNCSPAFADAEITISPSPIAIAGPDQLVKVGKTVTLDKAEIKNAGGCLWETSGDGSFTDSLEVITEYHPGQNDNNNLFVTLYLTANPLSPCTLPDLDEIDITFYHSCEDATAFAGNDTTVCMPGDILLSGTAQNYVSVLWTTDGDGTFENEISLITHYHPGSQDQVTGAVELTLKAEAADECEDASDSLILTILQSPEVNAGTDISMCQTQTFVELSGIADNYLTTQWNTSGNGTFSDELSLFTYYYPDTNDINTGNVTITLTAFGDNCGPVSDALIITIINSPTTNAGPDVTICQTATGNLSGSATHYSSVLWTTSGDGIFNTAGSLNTVYIPGAADISNGSVTLSLTANAVNPCSGSVTDFMVLTIQKSPTASAGVDATICQTATRTLSGTATNYSNVLWTTSGNGIFSSTSSLTPIYTPGTIDITNGSVTLTLTANAVNPCLGSVTDAMILTIQKSPTTNAGADATICQNQTKTLSGTATNYSSVLWTTSGNGTFSSASSLTPVYTPGTTDITNGSVTLTLTANAQSPCSGSVSDAMILTIRKSPTANAGNDATICENQTHSLSGTATNQLGVFWSTSGNGTFTNGNTLTAVYNPGTADISSGAVTLTLTATAISPCTVSATDTKVLIIQKSPAANAGADATICQGVTSLLSGTASNYSTILWTTSGNGTFSAASSLTPVYTPGTTDITNGSVTLTLTANAVNPCSGSVMDAMVLTIQKSPTANAGADATICLGGPITISGTATNYSSVLWTSSGDGTFTQVGSLTTNYILGTIDILNNSVTMTLTAYSISPCTVSASDEKILTFQHSPNSYAGTDATICQTGTHQLNGTASDYLALQWFTNGDGSFSSINILNPVYTPGTSDISSGSVTLTLTTSAISPCTVVVSDAMILQIQKSPAAYAGINATICQTGNHSLTGVASNYSSVLWSTSGNGTFSLASSLTPVYTPGTTDITNGSVTLTLTANAVNPCSGSVMHAMILTIQKSPTANAGNDATICQAETKTLSGTATNYSSVLWTTSGNGTFSSTSSLTPVYSPGTTDITNGSVTLTLTANAQSPCSGSVSDAMILTIRKSPTANAGADATICQAETRTLSGTATNYSSVLWTTSGNGTFSSTSSLTPVYTPGTTDVANGSVTLTLAANAVNPCSGSVTHAIVLTIQKSPIANAGADATICQTDDKTLSGTATNYSDVLWTTSGNGTFSPAGSLTTIYTPGPTDITNGSVTLTLTANAVNPCSGSVTAAMVLTIQKSPTAFAGADASILIGQNYQLADANAQFAAHTLWQTSGNGTFDSVNVVNTYYNPSEADYSTGSVILTLTADPVNPCLQNVYDDMVLSFSAICADAIANAGDDFAVCLPTVITLNGSAQNETGVLWITSGDGTFEQSTNLTSKYYPGQTDLSQGNVTLTLTAFAADPCSDDSDDVVVSFISQPTVNAGSDQVVCLPDATLVSGTAQNTALTLWETNGDGTFGDATALTTTYYPGALDLQTMIVTLCLTATGNTPCGYVEDCLTVTYNQKPVPIAGNDITVCFGTVSVNLYGSASNHTSFAWSTTGDGQFLPFNTTTLTPKYKPGVGDKAKGWVNIILSATNSTCGTQKDTMQITILHDAFAYAGEDATICGNESYNTIGAQVENAESVLWETNGDGTFDNPYDVITNYYPGLADNQAGYAILCLTANAFGNCPDDTWCITLTLSSSAYVNAGVDQGICDNQTVQLNAVGSNYNEIQWETSGDGTFSSTHALNPVYTPGILDISTQQVLLSITATSSGNCGNATDALTVLIGYVPTVNAGIDATICENENIMLSGQVQNSFSMLWTTSGDGTFDEPGVSNTIYNPGNTDVENGSALLTLTVLGNSPCTITLSDDVNIIIQRIPEVNAGSDVTICQSGNYQLGGSASDYTTLSWSTSGDGTFSSTNSLTSVYTPGIGDIEDGWAKISLQAVSASPCYLTSTDFMYLVIDRFPEIVLNLQNTQAQLNSNVFLVIGAIDGDEYQWYGPQGLIPGADGSVLALINVSPEDAGYYYCVVSNSCGTVTSNAIYLDVYVSHYVSIPAGWSGLSSFIEPRVLEVENLFAPVVPQLISLENFEGCYLPGILNTLVYYNPLHGYKAKFSSATIFEIRGSTNPTRTVTLQQGWNYLPVISTCPVNVAELFGGNTKVQIIKEIAGMGIYWPSVGINTINDMLPGRAYFIRVSESFDIAYPECPETKSSIITSDVLKAKNNSLWNEIIYTPTTHIVALDAGIYEILKPGDILGAFTPSGLCAGYSEIDGSRNGISLFGDDPYTPETDGFVENDPIRFKVYRPGTGEEFDLNVSYDLSFPNYNGQFFNHGMSGIIKSETTNLSISDFTTSKLTIYPNPATGTINILGLSNNSKIEICNTEGQLLKTINCTHFVQNDGTVCSFDLSGLAPGVVFFRIIEPDKVEIRKIILQ